MTPTTAAEKVKQIIESWEHATNHAPTGEWSADIFLASPAGSRLVGELVYGWISVDDRLPEEDCEVIASNDKDELVSICILLDGIWFNNYDLVEPCFPTHWQPLPEPPKIN